MQGNKVSNKFFAIIILALIICASFVSFTFAYFTDVKNAEINVKPAGMTENVTVTETLTPADLINSNTFTKTLSVNITSDFAYYYRVYAIVGVQRFDHEDVDGDGNLDEVIVDNSLVTVLGTDVSSVTDSNGKYYYTTSTTPTSVNAGTHSQDWVFTFQVSNTVSEELYTKSDFTVDTTLQTTITYYVEYCQSEGYSAWTGITA